MAHEAQAQRLISSTEGRNDPCVIGCALTAREVRAGVYPRFKG